METAQELPIFIRKGSIIPLSDGLLIYGDGEIVYKGVRITSENGRVRFSKPFLVEKVIFLSTTGKVTADNEELSVTIKRKVMTVEVKREVSEIKVT